MPVTLEEALAEVRGRLDELTETFWSDTQLKSWINGGCRAIARTSRCLEDIQEIDAEVGTRDYELPSNMIQLHVVEFEVSSTSVYPLELRNRKEMDSIWGTNQLQSQSTPSFAAVWGFVPNAKIYVYPAPSQEGTLNVWYYRLPTTAAEDEDVLEVPEGWDEAVYLWCEYIALRKDNEPRWQDAKALYEETLAELKNIPHHHDQQQYITTGPGNYMDWVD